MASTEVVKKFGKLHQIRKEQEKLKAQLDALKKEEEEIKQELKEDAITYGTDHVTTSGTKYTLQFPGVGSVTTTIKEEYVITDEKEALQIVLDNPIFVDAQKVGLDKKKFLAIALQVQQQTGTLVNCVQKEKSTSARINVTLTDEEEEE